LQAKQANIYRISELEKQLAECRRKVWRGQNGLLSSSRIDEQQPTVHMGFPRANMKCLLKCLIDPAQTTNLGAKLNDENEIVSKNNFENFGVMATTIDYCNSD
jgi:Viral A-type inclusion protein repeat